MYNSDLEWLPLSERKGINLPKIVYEPFEGQNYAGYHQSGSGILTIVERSDTETHAIIAHEFRHYTQSLRALLPNTVASLSLFDKFSYNKAIRIYYRESWHEMDALLFERKVSPTELNKFWLNACVLPKELDEEVSQ